MEILIQPTTDNAGLAIENGKIYHFVKKRFYDKTEKIEKVYFDWLPCGDCKIKDILHPKLTEAKQ